MPLLTLPVKMSPDFLILVSLSIERKGHLGEFLDPESSIVCQA